MLLLAAVGRGAAEGRTLEWGERDLADGLLTADLQQVAAGQYHSLGLRADGSVACWGDYSLGQAQVPAPNSGFIAVAAGGTHSLGLKANGSLLGWGANAKGQCNSPAPNSGFTSAWAGQLCSMGLKSTPPLATLELQLAIPVLACSQGAVTPNPLEVQIQVHNSSAVPSGAGSLLVVTVPAMAGDTTIAVDALAPGASAWDGLPLELLPGSCGSLQEFVLELTAAAASPAFLSGFVPVPCCGIPQLQFEHYPDVGLLFLSWPDVEGALEYRVYAVEQGWPHPVPGDLLTTTASPGLILPDGGPPPHRFYVVTAVFPDLP